MDITTWEYKRGSGSEKDINEIGKQGWEAVGISTSGDILFKRPSGILHINEVTKEHSVTAFKR
jgi:hypothetical protein